MTDAAARKEAYEAITNDPNLSSRDKARGRLALTIGTDALGLGDNARLRELAAGAGVATADAKVTPKEWVKTLPDAAKQKLWDALAGDLGTSGRSDFIPGPVAELEDDDWADDE